MDACNYNNKHDHNAFSKRIHACVKENVRTPVVMYHINIMDIFRYG